MEIEITQDMLNGMKEYVEEFLLADMLTHNVEPHTGATLIKILFTVFEDIQNELDKEEKM